MTIQDPTKPWAVVLMSLEGSNPPDNITDRVRRLFGYSDEVSDPTLADYWRDVTQGAVDISGSEVFGWYDCGFSMIGTSGLEPYPGVAGNFQRAQPNNPIDHAREVLMQHNPGLDLSKYRSVLAVYNFACDAGYTGGGVVWGTGTASDLSWAQTGWRRCYRCYAMVRTAALDLPCAAGGDHFFDAAEPVRQLPTVSSLMSSTGGFTGCSRCGGLVAASSADVCPAGGSHASDGSSFFLPTNWKGGIGDDKWHTCSACAAVIQTDVANDPSGVCPALAGKPHTPGSDEYVVFVTGFSFDLRFLGHEMGHAFGFIHSRSTRPESSSLDNDPFPGAYDDWFDIMSADSCDSFTPALPPLDYAGLTGPALSAHHLLTQGLLPSSAIWHSSPGKPIDNVTLRPVDTKDPGAYAVAEIGSFIAELRMTNGPNGAPSWDRALDSASAAVLVHDVADPGPVLMRSTRGRSYLLPGDTFEARVGLGTVRITVNAIDPAGRRAYLAINTYPYVINSWQRWLVIPCRYGQSDPAVTLSTLRDLQTDGVDGYWRDMSGGAATIHAGYVLSAQGNRSDAWFPLSAETAPAMNPTQRIPAVMATIIGARVPTNDKKSTTPFLLDWRWFTGIVLVYDAPIGPATATRMTLPSGNTPTVAGGSGTGDAAGDLTFDVIELGFETTDSSSLNRAIGESLHLSTVNSDAFHLMTTASAYRFRPTAIEDGVDPAWAPAGPAVRASDLALLRWLGGPEYTAPAPSNGATFGAEIRLAPLGVPGLANAGYWRAVIGPWSVECRLRRGWDDGLPQPIIVLAVPDGGPPIVIGDGESLSWVGGTAEPVSNPELEDVLGGGTITVLQENAEPSNANPALASPGATVRFSIRAGRWFHWGAVLRGNGTLYFTPRGRILRIPPGDPWGGELERAVDALFTQLERERDQLERERDQLEQERERLEQERD